MSGLRRLLSHISKSVVATNTLLQMGGQGFSIAVSLVTFALTSRSLGQVGYGHYGLALTYAAFVGIVLDAGLDTHVVSSLARRRNQSPKSADSHLLVTDATLVRIAAGALATLVATGAGLALGYPSQVIVATAVLSGTTLLTALVTLLADVFQAMLDVRLAVVSSIASRAITGAAIVALYAFGSLEIATLLLATFLGVGASFGLALIVSRVSGFRYVRPSMRRGWALYVATAPLAAWVILGQIIHRADAIILSVVHLDPSLALSNAQAVGIYVAAYRFFDLSNTLPGFLIATIMPRLASLVDDPVAFRGYLGRWLPLMALAGVAISLVFAVLGGPVLLVLSGPAFGPSAPIVVVLSIAIGLAFVTALLFSVTVVLSRRRAVAWLYLVVAVFNVAANLALDGRFGYWGAAWLTSISQFVLLLGMLWIVRDQLEVHR